MLGRKGGNEAGALLYYISLTFLKKPGCELLIASSYNWLILIFLDCERTEKLSQTFNLTNKDHSPICKLIIAPKIYVRAISPKSCWFSSGL